MSPKALSAPEVGNAITDHIHIGGELVPVVRRDMAITDVHLDPENPRIQHAVKQKMSGRTKPLSDDELRDLIIEQPGVEDLLKAIRDNGGLIEPIYVRLDGRVIEGNCRTASLLRLHGAKPADKRWQRIPAFLVPSITDRQIAILQGQFHVIGKNKWRAYEKAGHLHAMHVALKMDTKSIGEALGMQERVVVRLLVAYKTMRDEVLPKVKGKHGLKLWSYVEEFYKNKDLEEYRKSKSNVGEFVALVVGGKLEQGADVRQLPRILKNERATRVLKKEGIKAAVAEVGKQDPTADSTVLRKVKDLTNLLQCLDSTELQRVRRERRVQELFRELTAAIENVARTAGCDLEF